MTAGRGMLGLRRLATSERGGDVGTEGIGTGRGENPKTRLAIGVETRVGGPKFRRAQCRWACACDACGVACAYETRDGVLIFKACILAAAERAIRSGRTGIGVLAIGVKRGMR